MIEQESRRRILLVDEDRIILNCLGDFLEREGHEVIQVGRMHEAMDCIRGSRVHLVISDVSLPDGNGLELLRYVQAHCEETIVVLMTAFGSIESAVEAIKEGAYEYLAKPIIDDEIRLIVSRAMKQQQLQEENIRLKRALSEQWAFPQVIGQDYRMAKVFELMEAVADSRTNVLITGESGTGKSLVARAIHAHSDRSDRPFVEVACGALPDSLLESELFGHVRGAFTGAVRDKPGKFAAADGGTIFLDEISTASPQLQVKLLRVLQGHRFEPVGSNETRHVDVRVILATNRDLWDEVEAGRFREDLYYRINVVNIEVPPLRERLGDIPLLAVHFLKKFLANTNKRILGFSPETMERMQQYPWPGNVRELENCVERAVVLCRQAYIVAEDLPQAVLTVGGLAPAGVEALDGDRTLREALCEPEKRIILAALEANGHSRQATAKHLGINRTTLYKKMKRYGLQEA